MMAPSSDNPLLRRSLLIAGLGTAALAPTVLERLRSRDDARLFPTAAGAPGHGAPTTADRAEWEVFRSRHLAPDGRVAAADGLAHSEGQGYGLLLAEWLADQPGFEAMLRWTGERLGRPRDALHCGWLPGEEPRGRGTASSGDLLIAWALVRAASRWQRPDWLAAGRAIARDILRLLLREGGGRLLLLPGASGFETPDRIVVNLGYSIVPAFRGLAQAVPDAAWGRLEADALGLLRAARFGQWGLAPDWLEIARRSGGLAPALDWPPRFSADAARIPLHLAWAGLGREPVMRATHGWWSARGWPPPAWTDLYTNAVAPEVASSGIVAVARLGAAAQGIRPSRGGLPRAAAAPGCKAALLILLTRLAARETALPLG